MSRRQVFWDFLHVFAFSCRGDTVQNRVSRYDAGVRKEEETTATGKRGSLTAVRGGSMPLCAIGVRRIGPVRTSVECRGDTVQNLVSCYDVGVSLETETMDWGKRESRGAGLAVPRLLLAQGARRVNPVKISEEHCAVCALPGAKKHIVVKKASAIRRDKMIFEEFRGAATSGSLGLCAIGVRRIDPIRRLRIGAELASF
jgi:hypothetical protein